MVCCFYKRTAYIIVEQPRTQELAGGGFPHASDRSQSQETDSQADLQKQIPVPAVPTANDLLRRLQIRGDDVADDRIQELQGDPRPVGQRLGGAEAL